MVELTQIDSSTFVKTIAGQKDPNSAYIQLATKKLNGETETLIDTDFIDAKEATKWGLAVAFKDDTSNPQASELEIVFSEYHRRSHSSLLKFSLDGSNIVLHAATNRGGNQAAENNADLLKLRSLANTPVTTIDDLSPFAQLIELAKSEEAKGSNATVSIGPATKFLRNYIDLLARDNSSPPAEFKEIMASNVKSLVEHCNLKLRARYAPSEDTMVSSKFIHPSMKELKEFDILSFELSKASPRAEELQKHINAKTLSVERLKAMLQALNIKYPESTDITKLAAVAVAAVKTSYRKPDGSYDVSAVASKLQAQRNVLLQRAINTINSEIISLDSGSNGTAIQNGALRDTLRRAMVCAAPAKPDLSQLNIYIDDASHEVDQTLTNQDIDSYIKQFGSLRKLEDTAATTTGGATVAGAAANDPKVSSVVASLKDKISAAMKAKNLDYRRLITEGQILDPAKVKLAREFFDIASSESNLSYVFFENVFNVATGLNIGEIVKAHLKSQIKTKADPAIVEAELNRCTEDHLNLLWESEFKPTLQRSMRVGASSDIPSSATLNLSFDTFIGKLSSSQPMKDHLNSYLSLRTNEGQARGSELDDEFLQSLEPSFNSIMLDYPELNNQINAFLSASKLPLTLKNRLSAFDNYLSAIYASRRKA